MELLGSSCKKCTNNEPVGLPDNGNPIAPTLGASCDLPMFVQVCPDPSGAPQVEISDLAIGCTLDGDGQPNGTLVLSRVINEDTGVETVTRVAYLYDGSVVSGYTGPFGPCDQKCPAQAPVGVTASWG